MKKIKKNDLRLDKEVISSLSENELSNIKGGSILSYDACTSQYNPCDKTIACPPKTMGCSYTGCPSVIGLV